MLIWTIQNIFCHTHAGEKFYDRVRICQRKEKKQFMIKIFVLFSPAFIVSIYFFIYTYNPADLKLNSLQHKHLNPSTKRTHCFYHTVSACVLQENTHLWYFLSQFKCWYQHILTQCTGCMLLLTYAVLKRKEKRNRCNFSPWGRKCTTPSPHNYHHPMLVPFSRQHLSLILISCHVAWSWSK